MSTWARIQVVTLVPCACVVSAGILSLGERSHTLGNVAFICLFSYALGGFAALWALKGALNDRKQR